MGTVTVFVLGERERGDDGVGFAIAESLRPDVRDAVDIHDSGQLMPDALLDVEGPIIVIDAVDGPPVGQLVDVDLASLIDRGHAWRTASSHAVSVEMTLAIAAHLRGQVPRGRFIGVAGCAFEMGEEVSAHVRAAIPVAAARIATWVRTFEANGRTRRCA